MAEVGAAIARAKAAGKVLAVKLVGNEPGQAWDSSEVRVGACESPLAGVACVSGDILTYVRVSLQIKTRTHHHQSVASASTTGCSCGVCCAWPTLLEQTFTHTRNLEECATERASGRMLTPVSFFPSRSLFFSRCQLDKRHVMLITYVSASARSNHKTRTQRSVPPNPH
jgi:hypothetical protein